MCVTEIWIYRDCGCRYNHFVSCHPYFDLHADAINCPNERKENEHGWEEEGSSHFTFSADNSPTKHSCRTSSLHDGLEDKEWRYARRGCSVHHVVEREFLEPICDECVVEEARRMDWTDNLSYGKEKICTHTVAEGNSIENSTPEDTDAGLILESNVEIEIVPEHHSETHISTARLVVEEEDNMGHATLDNRRGSSQTPPPLPISSSTGASSSYNENDGDADDEMSLHTPTPIINLDGNARVRGRLRTRSKELRRRGMDISREELRLRIATGWTSAEKRSMEGFRRKLKGQSPNEEDDSVETSVPDNAGVGVTGWAQVLADKVGRSLGRGRRSRVRIRKDHDVQKENRRSPLREGAAAVEATATPLLEETGMSGSSISTVFKYGGGSGRQSETPSPTNAKEISDVAFTARSSWEQHLKEDLGERYRSSSIHATQDTGEMPPGCKADLHSDNEAEIRRRLLSASSTGFSTLTIASCSAGSSETWSGVAQPLRFSSGEFEHGEAGAFYGDWRSFGNGAGESGGMVDGDVTSIDDHTSIATLSLHGHKQSIDSRFSTTSASASPTPATQHHRDPEAATAAFSFHPLATPLRLATPVRPHPTPERSSSLFSPPAASAYRLRPESTTLRPSPTSAFICVKELVVCGTMKENHWGGRAVVCGNFVAERLVSCVCEQEIEAGGCGMGCRAEQVVREVLGKAADGEVCEACAGRQ